MIRATRFREQVDTLVFNFPVYAGTAIDPTIIPMYSFYELTQLMVASLMVS